MNWFTFFNNEKATISVFTHKKQQQLDAKVMTTTARSIRSTATTKASCIKAKTTLVNVIIDADEQDHVDNASRALSVELAKRTHSPSSSLRSRRSSYTFSSEKSQHSFIFSSSSCARKGTFSTLSTGVSITATTKTEQKTALESLSSLKDELLIDDNILQKPQQKNDADIASPTTNSPIITTKEGGFSWFRFSYASKTEQRKLNEQKIEFTDSPKAISLKDEPNKQETCFNPSSKGIAQEIPTNKVSSAKKRRNNMVLPKFENEFTKQKTIHKDEALMKKKPNFIIRAIEAINSVLIEAPPPRDNKSVDFDWLAKQMQIKFERFVEEIKSTDSSRKHKRITIIGTHGWFPMKLVRSMIGEPTGTSIKFCEQMSHCVKLYFEKEHQVTLPDDAMTIVPLEGEGKIEDRVEILYQKLIENPIWLEAVSSADVILWATHSQGTPVSTILLKRLLERGHIHTFRQSVCMLAMAGISHGPFPSLRDSLLVKYFEADAARELFEFMDSNSKISIQFRQSLSYILKRGTRIVLTGSMRDQVVPMYSAIMTATHHPNIFRQLYIDEDLYSEKDFLVNLVVLLVKIRNRGLSDHHLLTYLSEILAGSLYAIEGGHSTIYEELNVYMTAVRYTFETGPFGRHVRIHQNSDLSSREEEAEIDAFQAQQTFNPFYLLWALQGICTDQEILQHDELRNELKHLIRLFDEWKPTTAKLKDLKYKLEPFKSTPLL